ncbi:MAG: OmpA family protein, partial [Verrucomicrobiales bacterium]
LSAATSELAATEVALESTALFIDSIDLLPKKAKQLFLELSRLETVDNAELAKNYRYIEDKLGARVVDTIRFATGKSEISPAKSATIRKAMTSGLGDSFFLVIGYASKTGSFDLNKELSEARATAVATLAVEYADPGQKVRAVFLGQTDRFSSSDVREDQICELWEVPR